MSHTKNILNSKTVIVKDTTVILKNIEFWHEFENDHHGDLDSKGLNFDKVWKWQWYP